MDIQAAFLSRLETFRQADLSSLDSLSSQLLEQQLHLQDAFPLRFAKAIRKYFQKQVSTQIKHQKRLLDDELYSLLCFLFRSTDSQLVDTSLVFSFLEDISECLSSEDLDSITTFFDTQLPTFRKIRNTTDNSIISAILRIGNNILKKFSRSFEAQQRGRFRIAMSRLIPLSHKSGVNMKSDINQPRQSTQEQSNEDTKNLNKNFFQRFWQLQRFMQNPYEHALPSETGQKQTTQALNFIIYTLKYFQNSKCPGLSVPRQNVRRNPKYMVSLQLFQEQLNSPYFRLNFIVQIQLFIFCLRNQVPLAHYARLETTDEDIHKIGVIQDMIERMTIEPEAKNFQESLQYVLLDECFWQDWKSKQCPAMDKPTDRQEKTYSPLADHTDLIKTKLQLDDQDDLIQCLQPDDLEISTEPYEPSVHYYLQRVFQMMADKNDELQDYLDDPMFAFRALRTVQNHDLSLFRLKANAPNTMSSFVQTIANKMLKKQQNIILAQEEKEQERQNEKEMQRDLELEKEMQREQELEKEKELEREKEREKEQQIQREKEKEREREKEKEREREKEKEREREKEKERDKEKEREQQLQRDRERDREKDRSRQEHRERDYQRDRRQFDKHKDQMKRGSSNSDKPQKHLKK